jgi:outer membrane murein-binding lipoprotein Lpp
LTAVAGIETQVNTLTTQVEGLATEVTNLNTDVDALNVKTTGMNYANAQTTFSQTVEASNLISDGTLYVAGTSQMHNTLSVNHINGLNGSALNLNGNVNIGTDTYVNTIYIGSGLSTIVLAGSVQTYDVFGFRNDGGFLSQF